jgi:prefoldin subunit 5
MENNRSFGTLSDTKKNPAWKTIRAISDEICKELNLSVIENSDIGKGISHYEWGQKQSRNSWKAKLKDELDFIIRRADSFEDFLEKCSLNNIETVYQPDKKVSLKFRMSGQERFTRAKTLGYYYTPESIRKRIRNYAYHRRNIIDTSRFEAKGLQRWADIQNMKNVAEMINLLESHNIYSTAELKPTVSVLMAQRGFMSRTLEDLQSKINDISERIELVRTFQRTKSVFMEYKLLSPRRQKKFANENAPALESFHSAGARLRSLYPDGKFPSVSSLENQRGQLESERRELYREYVQLKQKSAEINKASQTIEEYLESQRGEHDMNRKKGELE